LIAIAIFICDAASSLSSSLSLSLSLTFVDRDNELRLPPALVDHARFAPPSYVRLFR
jgi:hypothetical protein